MPRTANVTRKTKETKIKMKLALDGSGECRIKTSVGFLDHMLTLLAAHGRFDLELQAEGDLRAAGRLIDINYDEAGEFSIVGIQLQEA